MSAAADGAGGNVFKCTVNQLVLDQKAASGDPIFHYSNTNRGVTILSRPDMKQAPVICLYAALTTERLQTNKRSKFSNVL